MKKEQEVQDDNPIDFSSFSLENILSPTFEPPVEDDEDDEPEPEPTPEPTAENDPEPAPTPEPDPKAEEGVEEETDLTGFYEALNKELGVDDFDVAFVEDGIPGLMGYLKTVVTNTIEDEVEQIKSMGDGILGDMYEYLKNGGKVEDFKQVYFDVINFKELPIEGDDNEANQKLAINEYLKELGFDEEERKDKIESYTSAGLLEKESRTAVKKLAVNQEQRQKALVENQTRAREAQETKVREYWDNVVNTINKADSIGGLPIPKNKKQDFIKYLTVRDKDGLTEYQRKTANTEESLKLALASFTGYDYASIKKEAKTEVTKDIKKTISRFTDTSAKSRSSIEVDVETNKKPDFSAFKLPIHY